MTRLSAILIIILFCGKLPAQHYTQQITNVKQQAQKWADAVIKHDYKTIMKFVNPEGIPKGKAKEMTSEKALNCLTLADSQMIKQGNSITSIKFGEVLSIVKVNFELQCTLDQTTETNMKIGRIISKSTLIGTSKDNGITWKFIDATGRDKNDIKKLVPRLSDKLVFAQKSSPQFILNPAPPPSAKPGKKKPK